MAARHGDGARGAMGHGLLEPVVGLAGEPQRGRAGTGGLVEPADRAQRLGAPALDLDDQVAVGRHAAGERQGAVVVLERLFGPAEIEVELAHELERQHLFPLGAVRAGALERVAQQALGLVEAALQARDVRAPDAHQRDAQIVGVAALLAHDAEVEERAGGLGEAAALAVKLERRQQMRLGRLPLAQGLVDQAQVVAHVGRVGLVAEAAIERQRLLVAVTRAGEVALAVCDAAQQVERLGRQ